VEDAELAGGGEAKAGSSAPVDMAAYRKRRQAGEGS
jgi:hypothetical protein